MSGLEEIFSNMAVFHEDIGKNAGAAIQNAGIVCLDSTEQRCPVRTGRLRASYQYTKVSDTECTVGSDVPYAPPVEFGTHKMSAQPHLFPGFQDGIQAFRDAIS